MSGNPVIAESNDGTSRKNPTDAEDKDHMIRVKPKRESKHSMSEMNMLSVYATKDQSGETTVENINMNLIVSKLISKEKSSNSLMTALKNMRRASLSKKNFEFNSNKVASLLEKDEKVDCLDSAREFHIELDVDKSNHSKKKLQESNINSLSKLQLINDASLDLKEGANYQNSSPNFSPVNSKQLSAKMAKGPPRKTRLLDEKLGVNEILYDKSKLLSVDFDENIKPNLRNNINSIKSQQKAGPTKIENIKRLATNINSTPVQKSKNNPQFTLNSEIKSKFVFDNSTTKVEKHRKNNYSTNFNANPSNNHTAKLKLVNISQRETLMTKDTNITSKSQANKKQMNTGINRIKPKIEYNNNNLASLGSSQKNYLTENKNPRSSSDQKGKSIKAVFKSEVINSCYVGEIKNITGNDDYLNILDEIHDIFGSDLKKFDEKRKCALII